MTAPKEKGSVSIYVYVPENTENFKEDVTLRDRKSHEQYELTDDGAVICEKNGFSYRCESRRQDHPGERQQKV